jgi:hypothetical protein
LVEGDAGGDGFVCDGRRKGRKIKIRIKIRIKIGWGGLGLDDDSGCDQEGDEGKAGEVDER